MAIVVWQSSQVATAVASLSISVSKPTSLAVGDTMVAQVLSVETASTAVAPAGWTTIRSDASTGSSGASSRLFYKVADAADVAASSFAFTVTNASNGVKAAITRFTGAITTSPVDQSDGTARQTGGASSAGVSTPGITPTKANGTFAIFVVRNDNSAIRTVSGYSITNVNPTWTERYDAGDSIAGVNLSMAMATGNRDDLTSTGNATASFNIANNTGGDIICILNLVPAPLTTASAQFTTNAAITLPIQPGVTASAAFSALAPIVSVVTAKWRNTAKNVASWLNTSKS